jgi:hypothetical protein
MSIKPTEVITQSKLISGQEVIDLYVTSQSSIVVIEDTVKGIKFNCEILPIDNQMYIDISENLQLLDMDEIEKAKIIKDAHDKGKTVDITLDEKTLAQNLKEYKEVYYPIMQKIFPICCVNPKILDGGGENAWDLRTVPLEVGSKILSEIMSLSGVSKEADKERKK